MTSAPAALSPVATAVQDGSFFQAGAPDASLNAVTAVGRWVAASSAVVSGGRSAAKASRNSEGDGAKRRTPGSGPPALRSSTTTVTSPNGGSVLVCRSAERPATPALARRNNRAGMNPLSL